jgi:hypothetical protein
MCMRHYSTVAVRTHPYRRDTRQNIVNINVVDNNSEYMSHLRHFAGCPILVYLYPVSRTLRDERIVNRMDHG